MNSVAHFLPQNQVTFQFQGELVRVKVNYSLINRTQVHPRGDRAKITGFSHRARKTLLETFARMDWHNHRAVFLTLTYHDKLPAAPEAKKHLRRFLKRVFRRFGNIPVIWRMEYQERGAIHFHLILIDLPFYPWRDCLKDWQKSTGDPTITNVLLRFLDNSKHVRRYVSKYVAKSPAVSGNLDTVSNLAVSDLPGRFWGIENRKSITWAELITIIAGDFEAFHDFKRFARKVWRGVNKRQYSGFSLFVGDAYQWHKFGLFCLS